MILPAQSGSAVPPRGAVSRVGLVAVSGPDSLPLVIDDPGWWPAARALLSIWRPGRSARLIQEAPLVGLRVLFLMFPVAIALILPLLWFVIEDRYAAASLLHLLIVGGVGVVGLAGVTWFRRMKLQGETGPELAGALRTNMFAKIAFSEAPALMAFVLCMAQGAPVWVYLAGMALSYVGFGLAAPGVADVRRRQEEVADRGSSLSLGDVLGDFPVR